MCDDWGGFPIFFISIAFAVAVLVSTVLTVNYHSGVKQQIAAQNQRNVNRCQTAIVCVDRVCDTVDGIFAPKEAAGEDAEK